MFADIAAFEDFLTGLGMFHMRLGMGRMRAAQRRLHLDQYGPALVQIVGTNGKGSTAFFLSRLAMARGLKAGLFTSPHFLSFRERIRINGRCVLPDVVLDWANHVQKHIWDLGLTYFELLTVLAMHGFDREGLDMVVLEAGLGGLNDATTAWTPDILLLTSIGLDHEQIIGPGIKRIAQDKAGAIRPGSIVITGPQLPQVMEVLARQAERKDVRLLAVDTILAGLPQQFHVEPGLAGEHQHHNARLALAGWVELCSLKGWGLDRNACSRALSSSSWPGRLQRIAGSPEIILDGAHNAPALETLEKALKALAIQPHALVFSCMRDKDLSAMADCIRRLADGPILVPELPTYERARPAREIADVLGEKALPVWSVAEAMDRAFRMAGPVLVCGSMYLLAEVFRLRPQWLEAAETLQNDIVGKSSPRDAYETVLESGAGDLLS